MCWVTSLLTDLILWLVPVFQVPVPQDHLENKQETYVTSRLGETDACVRVCVCVCMCFQ